MKAAVIQLSSTTSKERNLKTAGELLLDASKNGAQLCVLPEMFACLGPKENPNDAESLDGSICTFCSFTAKKLGIYLVSGSFLEAIDNDSRFYNTSCLFAPDGSLLSVYRKIHLFDCTLPGAFYQESKHIKAGDKLAVCPINQDFTLGMSICFDLRFPEMFRAMSAKGANVIVLPAAFTERTGRDHWEVLLRARAIENQAYVLASDQFGSPGKALQRYGRSIIVDPWGVVLAQAQDKEGYAMAEMDPGKIKMVKDILPQALFTKNIFS